MMVRSKRERTMKVKEELAFDYCGETNFDVTEAVPAFIAGFDTAKGNT